MSTPELKDTELIVPKFSKTGSHGKHAVFTNPAGKKGLFGTGIFETTTEAYEIVKPTSDQNDPLLRAQSPALLAFRKGPSRPMSRVNTRPTTGMSISAAQMMTSLITKKPLSNLREPPVETEQVEKETELEEMSIAFDEDPIAYFSKRKDGRGHRFIYMVYAGDRKDLNFSPYALKKVPSNELGNEYFTMSASGVTHVKPDGTTESMSLDKWSKESSIFMAIRKLRTFSNFLCWKPFRIWKKFVMRQRFYQLTDKVLVSSFFNNFAFYESTINILRESADEMLTRLLLSFNTQKMYPLDKFREICSENIKELKEEYKVFLENVVAQINQLDEDIRDPARVIVEDNDFPEIKRRNPNLGQLMVLERKKYAEKNRRNEIVQKEIRAFGDFVRLIDYILLEQLSKSCFKCWYFADNNVSTDRSSIFEIQVSFSDDGEIVFIPSLEDITSTVNTVLLDSLATLNSLPRVIRSTTIRAHLRESIPDLNKVFDDGPSFKSFIDCNEDIERIREHIIAVLTYAYNGAYETAQQFKEYFPIYQIGQKWTPQIYIRERGGSGESINLAFGNQSPFVFDPTKELTIDFDLIRKDFERFKADDLKMNQFRSCTLRGALYVDSKGLRANLKPIPQRAQYEIQQMLKDLAKKKVEYFQKIFTHCHKYLRKDPTTLPDFVDFCEFMKKCQQIEPYLVIEVKFVDSLLLLFEEFKIASVEGLDKNQLHSAFSIFKADQQSASGTYNIHNAVYINNLENQIRNQLEKLQRVYNTVTAIPISIQQCDIDAYIPAIEVMEKKIHKYEPNIINLTHYQKVLGISKNNFSIFTEVKKKAEFDLILYRAVATWKSLSQIITMVPLSNVNVKKFKDDLLKLDASVQQLKEMNKEPVELLNELETAESAYVPHIEVIELLSNGRMQTHHWNTLFEECGRSNAYYAQIKIDELVSLGILDKIDKIREITKTSQGESKLESEFQSINTHWEEVNLPLLEGQDDSDNNLTLGNLDMLFSQIADTQLKLENMLNVPFVQGIKDNVLNLSLRLEQIAKILDEWLVFQSNWPLLSILFSHDDIKSVLPACVQKFQTVKRRWESIVKNTRANTLLFQACAFPHLLEILNDNNKQLVSILSSVMKYIDIKRAAMPRLYFMSNQEILSMITTKDFTVFNHQIAKMFMHIRSFDSHIIDEKEARLMDVKPTQTSDQNFCYHRLTGMVGDDGDTITFTKYVQITGDIDEWGQAIIEAMKTAVKENVGSSIARYTSSTMKDWVSTVSTYIALLTLQICFARDIQECFNNVDNQGRAFAAYEQVLQSKIVEISSVMNSPLLSPSELLKLSSISAFINYQMAQVKPLADKFHNYSQEMNWRDHIRFRFNGQASTLFIDMGDATMEHGYEFWGSSMQFIHTPASERVLNNAADAVIHNKFPMICGGSTLGKKQLIAQLATLFGRFIFFVPAFQETPIALLTRIVNGAALTGCWLAFNNVDKLSHHNLSFIYNIIHSMNTLQSAGGSRINISGHIVELQKSTRILLSGHYNFIESEEIPPELRTILKPISFAAPDCLQITNVKLISTGFKFTKIIAAKMHSLITTITRTFEYLKNKSFLSYVFVILNDAHDLLRQILHQKSADFINYYEEPRIAEEFVVARAIYLRFISDVKPEHHNMLLQLIFADFHLFGKFEVFKDHIMNPNCFNIEQAAQYIKETLEKELESRRDELDVDYIIQQVIRLYWMMLKFPCIIIVGPPNSGKTLVVEMLQKAFIVLAQNADIINRFNGIMPVKIVDVFHESEKYQAMFGSLKEVEEIGTVQQYGLLNTYISQLNKFEKTHHRLLRFNGPMTPQFVSYIEELFSTSLSHKCRINTMDTMYFDHGFHILVETGNLSCISPSCVASCGILPMKPVITKQMLVKQSVMEQKISDQTKEILKKYFEEYSEQVVKFIEDNDGILPGLKTNMKKFMLHDSLLRRSLKYACEVIISQQVPEDNEESIRIALLHSMFTIISGIITKECSMKLDSWMKETFNIITPRDWEGYDITEACKETFPTPSLRSTRVFKNQLIPLDFSLTKEAPIFSTKGLPYQVTIEDASVCTPEMLSELQKINILLKNNENIFLHGNQGSGKTAFLRQLFARQPNFIPIFIPVTISATGRSLLSFIRSHTPVITKNYAMMKSKNVYALIFEDVPPSNYIASEFIRQIIERKKVSIASKIDQKYFEEFPIRNSVVIVTSSNMKQFGRRFMKNLVPVYLPSPTISSMDHIFGSLENYFQFSDELKIMFKGLFRNLRNNGFIFNELQFLQVFPFLSQRSSNRPEDISSLVAVIIEQIHFVVNPKTQEEADKLEEIIGDVFASYEDVLKEYKSGFIFRTNLQCAQDLSSIKAVVLRQDPNVVIKELEQALDAANAKVKEHISIPFTTKNVNQFLKIQRAFDYPGGSAFLTGHPSSTRRSLVRLLACKSNMNFVEISQLSPVNQISESSRMKLLNETMREAIHNALIKNESTIIFMRAEENNKAEQRVLYYFLHRLNFTEFYNPGSLDQLYKDYAAAQNIQVIQDPLALYSKIKILLRHKIHICITTDVSETKLNFAHVYAINFLQEQAIEENIARRMPDYTEYSPMFAKIHSYIADLFPDLISPSILNDFTKIFKRALRQRLEGNKIMHSQKEKAKKFFDEISQNLKETNDKIEKLTPKLKEIRENKEKIESEYEAKKKELIEKIENLDKEEASMKEEIEKTTKQIEDLRETAKKALEDSSDGKRKIDILGEKDLAVFQIPADNPPIKLKLFIRVVSVLCGLDPTYEVDGKNLIMRNDLFRYLTTTIVPTNISDEVSLKACQAFQQGNLTMNDMESISPTAGSLFRWINSVVQYLSATNQTKILSSELKQKQVDYETYLQDIKPDRESIAEVSAALEVEAQNIMQHNKDQEEFEQTYQKCLTDQAILESIISDGDKFIDRVVNDVDIPENATVSDSIFIAAYKTYSGYLNQEQLDQFFDFIKELVTQENLELSGRDPEFRTAFYIALSTPEHDASENFKFNSFHTELAALNALDSVRVPLILDQDGFVTNYIEKLIDGPVIHLSALSSKLDESLPNAMSTGKTVIMHDVDSYNHVFEGLFGFFSLKNHDAPTEIALAKKVFIANPKFKIFFISSKSSPKSIPYELASRTRLVNGNIGSIETGKLGIEREFVNFMSPNNAQNVMSERLFELRRNVSIARKITNILELLSDYKNEDHDKLALIAKEKNKLVELITTRVFLHTEVDTILEPIKALANLSKAMWTCLSAVMPTITGANYYKFSAFISALQSGISQTGYKNPPFPEEQIPNIKTTVVNSILKYVLTPFKISESLVFMFFTSVILRYQDKIIQKDDVYQVVTHINDALNGKCDANAVETVGILGDALDGLKTASITNIFAFVTRIIAEQFSANFATAFPTLAMESFIQTNSANPVFIISDLQNDPTTLLESFVTSRNRLDSFESFSLSDDPVSLNSIVQFVTSVTNKGMWIALHYSKPSPAAASALVDIYTAMTSGSLSTNFRLIIIAQSQKYIPSFFLQNCTRYSYNTYPSVRQQMLQIYQHYYNSIRSSTNTKLIKKYAYAAALMHSVIHFRNSLGPIGFTQFTPVPEITVKGVIEMLRIVIDSSPQGEIPIRNVRDRIQNTLLSGATLDTFDRRKLRVHIFSIFSPEVTDDAFRFVDPYSSEVDTWIIPPDAPITNYTHIIAKLPVFNSCDVLIMPPSISQPIRGWYIGKMIAEPISMLMLKQPSDIGLSRIKEFIEELPKPAHFCIQTTPTMQWARNEIELLNDAIEYAKQALQNLTQEDIVSFTNNIIPKHIVNAFNYAGAKMPKTLSKVMSGKMKFLMQWMDEGMPCRIDVNFVNDLKGLINAYTHEISTRKNIVVDAMMLDYQFSLSSSPGALVLTNVHLMAGNWDDGNRKLVQPNHKSKPYTNMPPLVIKQTNRIPRGDGRMFMCPLFKSSPSADLCTSEDRVRIDGEIENFIKYIPVTTDVTDKYLIAAGTAFVCHIPEEFQ